MYAFLAPGNKAIYSLSIRFTYWNLGLDCSLLNTINENFITFSTTLNATFSINLGMPALMSCNRANIPIKNTTKYQRKNYCFVVKLQSAKKVLGPLIFAIKRQSYMDELIELDYVNYVNRFQNFRHAMNTSTYVFPNWKLGYMKLFNSVYYGMNLIYLLLRKRDHSMIGQR